MITASNNTEVNLATADTLALLPRNQHVMGATIEEMTKWLSRAESVANNSKDALKTLDSNARAITNAIMWLRHS